MKKEKKKSNKLFKKLIRSLILLILDVWLLVIGLFVGYRFLRKRIISNTDYKKDYKKLCVFCCVFAVACALAATVLVHKNVLDTTVLLKKADSSGYNVLTDYFYKENVSFNGVFQFLYTAFISILFRFYGIAIEVPVITNLILFLVSGIFVFIVIYKVFGVCLNSDSPR